MKDQVNQLDGKLLTLISEHEELKNKTIQLNEEVLELKAKLKELRAEHRQIEDENQRLKVVTAMTGSPEHRRLMKSKMNHLIKEINLCIGQLKNLKA